jgi:hypothetical protein
MGYEGVEWIQMTQLSQHCRALVNTLVNILVP